MSKLDELTKRIEAAKNANLPKAENNSVSNAQLSLAWRISIELVAGVMVGAILGYFLDQWSGLAPLFLLTGILLGSVAGFRNMLRTTKTSTDEKPND